MFFPRSILFLQKRKKKKTTHTFFHIKYCMLHPKSEEEIIKSF